MKRIRQIYLSTSFLLVMVVSLVVTVLLAVTGERIAAKHAPLFGAAMEVKLHATLGHLWFEEIVAGDSHEDIEVVWRHLKQADWYALAMLEGGSNAKGTYRPLDDPMMRTEIVAVRGALHDFESIARARHANAGVSFPGSDIDQIFDQLFNNFLDKADRVQTLLLALVNRDLSHFRYMSWLLIGLMTAVLLVVGYLILRLERQRTTDLSTIEIANQQIREKNTELDYLAHFDSLTKLPNRTLFIDRLARALAHAERKSTHVVLLFLDLDKFKSVNDRLGHAIGDEVLTHAASRLKQCLRSDDSIARLGGDEFTVILSDIDNHEQAINAAKSVARSVTEEMSAPFGLDKQMVTVTVSIGIAVYPEDGMTGDELLINADHAMYDAKAHDRGGFRFHSAELNRRVTRQLTMESDLYEAIDENQLVVYYQPQWDLQNDTLSGVEALVRWQHPVEGKLMPNAFIPVAESSGIVERIDAWVLRAACRQVQKWRSEGLEPGRLAVNISASLFSHGDLFKIVSDTLIEHQMHDGELELELTESALLKDVDHAQKLMQRLRRQGVNLAIDDFGTGYSSMAYLRDFPITTLKIDRSFIMNAPDDKAAGAILHSMVELATHTDKVIVAEGIETKQQEQLVRSLGCEFAQGFLLGKPRDAGQMQALLIAQTEKNVRYLPYSSD
ncbi:MAG: EAL domain-containing protein [Candidatus Thiodiazotropha sp. (ex. Lucinoma kazani)]